MGGFKVNVLLHFVFEYVSQGSGAISRAAVIASDVCWHRRNRSVTVKTEQRQNESASAAAECVRIAVHVARSPSGTNYYAYQRVYACVRLACSVMACASQIGDLFR